MGAKTSFSLGKPMWLQCVITSRSQVVILNQRGLFILAAEAGLVNYVQVGGLESDWLLGKDTWLGN